MKSLGVWRYVFHDVWSLRLLRVTHNACKGLMRRLCHVLKGQLYNLHGTFPWLVAREEGMSLEGGSLT